MCIISNKQEDVLEKILICYVLILKCPNAFYILKGFDLFTFRDKKTVKNGCSRNGFLIFV